MSSEEMKNCPKCYALIDARASVCRECNSSLGHWYWIPLIGAIVTILTAIVGSVLTIHHSIKVESDTVKIEEMLSEIKKIRIETEKAKIDAESASNKAAEADGRSTDAANDASSAMYQAKEASQKARVATDQANQAIKQVEVAISRASTVSAALEQSNQAIMEVAANTKDEISALAENISKDLRDSIAEMLSRISNANLSMLSTNMTAIQDQHQTCLINKNPKIDEFEPCIMSLSALENTIRSILSLVEQANAGFGNRHLACGQVSNTLHSDASFQLQFLKLEQYFKKVCGFYLSNMSEQAERVSRGMQ